MKRIERFFIMIYYKIYLHFYHCKGDCDACYAKNSRLYLVCSHQKLENRNKDIFRYINYQTFCERAKQWANRYSSFEKMLKKIRNPQWLMYSLYYYGIKRSLIAKANLDMIDMFIPYPSDRNKELLARAYYILNKHGIKSKQIMDFRVGIKEPFEMHVEGEDDTNKMDMYIASAIKHGVVGGAIIPSIMIIAGEQYYGKWTLDKTYKMVCDCLRQNCGEELLKTVDSEFQAWKLRKLLSSQ